MRTIKDKVFTYLEEIVNLHNNMNFIQFPKESYIELVDIGHTNNVGNISIQYTTNPTEIGSISYDFQGSYAKLSITVGDDIVMKHKNIDYKKDWKEFTDLFYHIINYLGTLKTTQAFRADITNIENQNFDSLSEIYQNYCSVMDLSKISAEELYTELLDKKPLIAKEIYNFLDIWNKVEEDEININDGTKSESNMKVEVHHMKINELTGFIDGFEHVANVWVDEPHCQNIAEALEYAYRYTNNVDGSWSKKIGSDANDKVDVLVKLHVIDNEEYGLRSSSMGDVFVVNGEEYKVDTFGFRKLDEPIVYSDKDFSQDTRPFSL